MAETWQDRVQVGILIFDGQCNLCNGVVRFVIRHDRGKKIRFAQLQSAAGQALIRSCNSDLLSIDSVIYISGEKAFIKSEAVLNLLKDIRGGWQLLFIFHIVPVFVRDFIYDRIAGSRYRLFGKSETCIVPDEEIKKLFLT